MDNYNNYSQVGVQSPYNPPIQEQKSNKKVWLWALILALIIIIGFVIFYSLNSSSVKISDNQLSYGTNIQLKESKEAKFILDDEEHTIKINYVGNGSANLIIQSDPIQVDFKIGEKKKFDLNGDGFYDLQIKLNKIESGVPELHIKKIHESVSTTGTNNGVISPNTINPEEIILDIIIPKESYDVDEEVDGDYYLKYGGKAFEGAIIYGGPGGLSMIRAIIYDVDFNDPDKIKMMKVALKDTFYHAGIYNYSIYVYNCEEIDETLATEDCGGKIGNLSVDEIVEKVNPLKSKFKSIAVVGENEEYEPECTNNDDCTQTCTNCDRGTYACAMSSNPLINQKCVECVSSFSCIEGYGCVDNVCVVEECDSGHLNLCLDETTCTGAGGYWYGDQCNLGEQVTVTNPNTILDCYNENISELLCSPEDAIGFTDLFETRLDSCEISQGTFALGFEPFMGIFRGYEIQGEQGDNCSVRFWFLENIIIDSSLLNKEMVCEYDSSQRTATEVNGCLNDCCTGELVDALNSIMQ